MDKLEHSFTSVNGQIRTFVYICKLRNVRQNVIELSA